MKTTTRIYLIGMMGSGKTTLAKQLAPLLGYSMVDLDEKIVELEKMDIPTIFHQKGEAYFRQKESETLKSILSEKIIMATGGGAPCFFDNMDFMLQNGLVVFLDVDVKTLTERVLRQKGERPLITSEKPEEVYEMLAQRLNQRLPFYQKAHLTLRGKINGSTALQQIQHYL